MREISPTRASSSSSSARADGATLGLGLRHRDLRVGERRDLCEMGHTQTPGALPPAWRARGRTAGAGLSPMPASTSSKTSVGGAAERTTLSASIARASSPPEAALARGRAGSPGLGARRKVTSSRPSLARGHEIARFHGNFEVGVRHRELPQPGLNRLRQAGAAARLAFDNAPAACATA